MMSSGTCQKLWDDASGDQIFDLPQAPRNPHWESAFSLGIASYQCRESWGEQICLVTINDITASHPINFSCHHPSPTFLPFPHPSSHSSSKLATFGFRINFSMAVIFGLVHLAFIRRSHFALFLSIPDLSYTHSLRILCFCTLESLIRRWMTVDRIEFIVEPEISRSQLPWHVPGNSFKAYVVVTNNRRIGLSGGLRNFLKLIFGRGNCVQK